MNARTIGIVAILGVLAGCGTTPADRTISGAGLGAGAGAALGALSGSAATGAALGAVAGGLAGAVTSPSQVNGGEPPWRQHHGHRDHGGRTSLVAWIQSRLQVLGYYKGPSNGDVGPRTRAAIRAYQRDHGLLVDGEPSPALAEYMYRES